MSGIYTIVILDKPVVRDGAPFYFWRVLNCELVVQASGLSTSIVQAAVEAERALYQVKVGTWSASANVAIR